MYAAAWMLSGSPSVAAATGIPYSVFHVGSLDILGLPIQGFGVIVAAGVLIGAALLRRYGEWHGISDEEIRGLTGWVTVFGFLGAHVFDTLFYEWPRFSEEPLLIFKIWDGISSYGGFVGGALGFALFVWWKRLPVRLFADTTIVGLIPAFSIGRLGCTLVSDHVGGAADPTAWYSFLAMDYARSDGSFMNAQHQLEVKNSGIAHLFNTTPGAGDHLLGWNLGLIELLYLIPINLLLLWLAFRATKRLPAGFITALAGMLYAPVRFFLDYLRPDNSDPRHFGFTFAQWCSILAFGIAVYAANRVLRKGKVFPTVTRTSGEAQAKLKSILKDDGDKTKRVKEEEDAEKTRKEKEKARLKEEQRLEDEALEREAMEAGKKAAKAEAKAEAKADKAAAAKADEPDDDEAGDDEDDAEAEAVPEPAKPVKSGGQNRPSGQSKKPGQNKKKKKKR